MRGKAVATHVAYPPDLRVEPMLSWKVGLDHSFGPLVWSYDDRKKLLVIIFIEYGQHRPFGRPQG